MEKRYYYRVYGLNIKSDIEIKEFIEINGCSDVDISIEYGEPSEDLISKFKDECTFLIAKDNIVFDIKGIGTYGVYNGNLINYKSYEGADPYYVKIFITCSCIGFIMIQRNKLAIHGGAVSINDNAIIITGDKGAGKSSLTTGLRKYGYELISDDIASIDFTNNIVVNPGFPYQKLCTDAVLNMGYNIDEYFSFMSDTKRKYVIPVTEHFKMSDTKLAAIFEITKGDLEKVSIEEVSSSEKLEKIIECIYRIEYIDLLGGMKPQLFKKCIILAKNIKFYKITRPVNGFTVDEQIKLIENKIIDKKLEEIV